MTDKTEVQIQKEREAVEAMRNAKANMAGALDRIATLESALRSAAMSIGTLKTYIAPSAYTYPVDGRARRCTDDADAAALSIAKALGA